MNLFGPLFKFELIRVARKQRLILGRCVYIIVLLCIIATLYLMLFPHGPSSLSDFLFRTNVDQSMLAQFSFTFFCVFAMLQFGVAAFATASAAAVPLAEEKERKTLEFLLTTPLSDREIVFGKLAARVAQILFVLLAGLPVLALMQFMGGVDPALLGAVFGATLVMMLSVAGVAAAVSVRAPTVRVATSRTLSAVTLYLLACPVVSSWLQRFAGVPPIMGWYWFPQLLEWLNAGNPFWVAGLLGRALAASGRLDVVLPVLFWKFVAFHSLVALATGGWAALRLRKILARQHEGVSAKSVRKKASDAKKESKSRTVYQDYPVLWREICTAAARAEVKWWVRGTKRVGYLICFVPLVMALTHFGGIRSNIEPIHIMVRSYGTLAISISLLHIASVAGASLDRERRKKTFDELALTVLSNREILFQKGLAALWSARWYWLWLAVYWLVDLLVGGMSILAPLIVLPLYALYAMLAMKVGLFFAVRASPQIRPGGTAMLALILGSLLPWIVPIGFLILSDNHRLQGYVATVALGACPPAAIGALTLGTSDLDFVTQREFPIVLFLIGLAINLVACAFLTRFAWRGARLRFKQDRPE